MNKKSNFYKFRFANREEIKTVFAQGSNIIYKDFFVYSKSSRKLYYPYFNRTWVRFLDKDSKPIDDVNMDLSIMTYSFGRVVATNYFEKLKNNFDEEWKNYKNFICTVNYLPMNEVIEDVFDTEIVEENIKKFTKSYQSR